MSPAIYYANIQYHSQQGNYCTWYREILDNKKLSFLALSFSAVHSSLFSDCSTISLRILFRLLPSIYFCYVCLWFKYSTNLTSSGMHVDLPYYNTAWPTIIVAVRTFVAFPNLYLTALSTYIHVYCRRSFIFSNGRRTLSIRPTDPSIPVRTSLRIWNFASREWCTATENSWSVKVPKVLVEATILFSSGWRPCCSGFLHRLPSENGLGRWHMLRKTYWPPRTSSLRNSDDVPSVSERMDVLRSSRIPKAEGAKNTVICSKGAVDTSTLRSISQLLETRLPKPTVMERDNFVA